MEFKPGMRVIVEVDQNKGHVYAPLEDGIYSATVIRVDTYGRSVQVYVYVDGTDFILATTIIDNDLWYHGICIRLPEANDFGVEDVKQYISEAYKKANERLDNKMIENKRKELNRLWDK